jgi:NitT/TauT family transport system substrate-binding protein
MSFKTQKLSAVLGALACAAAAAFSAPASALETVTYNMAWLPQGSSIGVIVAQEQGLFKKEGLDVQIVRGYGGNRTANELDQGKYEFGYVDPVSLILNRVNGGHIRMIGALNTQWPAGICFDKSRHDIKGIDDLKGLTMGGGSASPVQQVVPAWLQMNGKPKDFVHLLRMDPAVVDASLVEGRIDLAECWRASNREVMQKRADQAGVKLGWIEYSDHGLNAYGSGFAASEDLIKKNPGMIKKFLSASYAGYQYAIAHPQEARDLMVKMFPVVDPAVALHQIEAIDKLIVDPGASGHPMGYLRADRMQSTVEFVDKAFDVGGKVKAADIYTNDLLQ